MGPNIEGGVAIRYGKPRHISPYYQIWTPSDLDQVPTLLRSGLNRLNRAVQKPGKGPGLLTLVILEGI
tara:strand:+ start:558 stop:761 length:204 start_codon:yes stop_codon:yes gene_type:complete